MSIALTFGGASSLASRGSHHLFRREDVAQLINLQRDGAKAKVYQVRQLRAILLRYAVGVEAPPPIAADRDEEA